MNLADFQYRLPRNLIAQYPSRERDQSRLMVVDRDTGSLEHRTFRDLPEYLNEGDALVVNDTRVIKAKLLGRKEAGGRVEVLITEKVSDRTWKCMLKRARSIRNGSTVYFGDGLSGQFLGRNETGSWRIEFESKGDFYEAIDQLGHMPLPPYIKRKEPLPLDERSNGWLTPNPFPLGEDKGEGCIHRSHNPACKRGNLFPYQDGTGGRSYNGSRVF
jgi:S-adenosylmethionine:tRNA ribosyltransferase-isomerase